MSTINKIISEVRVFLLSQGEKKVLFLHAIFYYPAVFILVYYLTTTNHFELKVFLEKVLFTTVLLLFSSFIPWGRFRLFYLLFTLIVTYLITFVEASYFYLYKNSISESTIFILLETNSSESWEFLSMYFDKHIARICIALFIPLVLSAFLLIKSRRLDLYSFKFTASSKDGGMPSFYVSLFLIALLCTILFKAKLYQRNIMYVTVKSLRTYQKQATVYKSLGVNKMGGKFSNISSDTQQEQLYVVIIGESTTRHHMSLYNYYRKTNPLLEKIKNNLIIYNDVISPHTHTIPSLSKVLTLANYEHPERSKDGSLLQLMNKAGFETYWISNQNPIGTDETLITILSKAAAKSYFTNTAGWRKSFTPYDEKLLIPLKKVLSEKKRKKFIILHLMGTHSKYSKRYPESFKQFNTTPITAFKHEVAFNLINEYDNAVLYNDQIVSKVIDLVRNENENAWVLYFSDHGEDVFETIDATSHRETGGTKPMYDIPFVFWVSEKYKQQDKDHIYQSERKFMTDDLIYTIADMSNVHFTEFDSTRSLINPNFIHRKRKINEKEDYDEKFSNN